jgi:hypothetical protein
MSGPGKNSPQVIDPARSPALYVPIGMALAGVAGLIVLQALLLHKAPMIFGPFRFNPAALAAAHTFTLGFATSVMIGAFYQITPVMMLGRPVAGRLALLQGVVYLCGAWSLVWGFYSSSGPWITAGGTAALLSLILFAVLVGRSMRSATQWTVAGRFMAVGLSFLLATAIWGLVLAFNLRYGFIPNSMDYSPLGAHVLVGFGGWFMLTVFGVSYQLFPMFALSQRQDARTAHLALGLLGAGLGSAFIALLLHLHPGVTAGSLVLAAAGIGVYARDAAAILRQRRRRELDLSMRYALTALGFLGLALPLLVLSPMRHGLAVPGAWLFLVGFVATMILGMLYKIVPFLFWHYLLKTRRSKTQRLPNLDQMFSLRAARAGYWCWTSGVVLTGLLLLGGALELWDARGLVRVSLPLNLAASLLFAGTILQVLQAKPLD